VASCSAGDLHGVSSAVVVLARYSLGIPTFG